MSGALWLCSHVDKSCYKSSHVDKSCYKSW